MSFPQTVTQLSLLWPPRKRPPSVPSPPFKMTDPPHPATHAQSLSRLSLLFSIFYLLTRCVFYFSCYLFPLQLCLCAHTLCPGNKPLWSLTPGPSHFPLCQESSPSPWLILLRLSGLCIDIPHFWNSPDSEPSRAGATSLLCAVSTVLSEVWHTVSAQ